MENKADSYDFKTNFNTIYPLQNTEPVLLYKKKLTKATAWSRVFGRARNSSTAEPHPSDFAVFLYPFSGVQGIKYLLAGNNFARSLRVSSPRNSFIGNGYKNLSSRKGATK